MKTKLFLLISLFACLNAMGQSIDANKAKSIAQAFVKSNISKQNGATKASAEPLLTQIKQQEVLPETSGNQLFIYNVGNDDGFVIIGGDERVPEVLGYADNGSINPQNMPDALRMMLSMYASEIKNLKGTQSIELSSFPAIEPIVTSLWNQGAPYNLQCPDNSVTGCVATAMAQVLYANVKPVGCTSLYEYMTRTNNTYVEDLPETTFDWGIIKDDYNYDESGPEAQEVAKLMRYCGQAVEMDYTKSGSGAYSSDVVKAFYYNFRLEKTIKQIYRQYYPSAEWENKIYKELSEHRSVYLSGYGTGGHAFVCDGYNGSGLYHINWGWGGSSNGYFFIDQLDPSDQGIGGSAGGYSCGINAITGVKEREYGEKDQCLQYYWSGNNVYTNNYNPSDKNIYLNVGAAYYCLSRECSSFDIGFGIFDEDGQLLTVFNENNTESKRDMQYLYGNCVIPEEYRNYGTLYIKMISRQSGENEWQEAPSYTVPLKITIQANTVDIFEDGISTGYDYYYEFSDFNIDGSHIDNTPQQLTFTVENRGNTYTQQFDIMVDGESVNTVGVNIDPGETKTYTFDVNISGIGMHKVSIAEEYWDQLASQWLYRDLQSMDYEIFGKQFCGDIDFKLTMATPYKQEYDYYYVNTPDVTIHYEANNTHDSDYCGEMRFVLREGINWMWASNYMGIISPQWSNYEGDFSLKNLKENADCTLYVWYEYEQYNYKYANNNINFMYIKDLDIDTGINDISTSDKQSAFYSLDGRKVTNPKHGIFIRNGKKVYVK